MKIAINSYRPSALTIIIAMALVMLPHISWAECAPDNHDPREITAPELKKLTGQGAEPLIINVLSDIEYDMQHISGSINIPINQLMTTTKLPDNKEVPLVFYCLSAR